MKGHEQGPYFLLNMMRNVDELRRMCRAWDKSRKEAEKNKTPVPKAPWQELNTVEMTAKLAGIGVDRTRACERAGTWG